MTREEAIKQLELLKLFDCPHLLKAKRMAIAALREQEERRWISCKEKLPSKNQKVIFYCPSSDAIYTGRFNYVGKNGTVWFKTGRTACSYGGSHWMPLPEPPKEDSNGETE